MAHLLVTNDFPPKVGGIQSYLWELWRRLPSERVTVLTTPYAGASEFDAAAPFRIVRSPQRVLLPTPRVVPQIRALAAEVGASLIVLDPALPLGWVGPRLAAAGLPYAVVLHGAEVTVPGRLPGSRAMLRRVLRGATHTIAAGNYPLREGERAARRSLAATVIPPGVDVERLHPVGSLDRAVRRRGLGLPAEGPLVVSASRLVPRKGIDVLIEASALVAADHPGLVLAVSGSGRDRKRLERLGARARRRGLDVRFLGRLDDDALASLYRVGDVFAMLCRNRWLGLEQEGFGIVFVEAAASGTPQIAGASGGAADAVVDGVTGVLIGAPRRPADVATALDRLLRDAAQRTTMGAAGRVRAVRELSYDVLAARLDDTLLRLEKEAAARR